jgi:hypothetical protein
MQVIRRRLNFSAGRNELPISGFGLRSLETSNGPDHPMSSQLARDVHV